MRQLVLVAVVVALGGVGASGSARADATIVEPPLGYLNRRGFFERSGSVEVGAGVVAGDHAGDEEVQLGIRIGGYLRRGDRSLGGLQLGRLRVLAGVPLSGERDRELQTLIVQVRPVGYAFAGALQIDLLPVQVAREHRVGRDGRVRADLIGVTARVPVVGTIGPRPASLLVHVEIAALGVRGEAPRAGERFAGLDVGSVDAALSLVLGESFWGTRRRASAALSLGGSAGTAVGDSTAGSADWFLDAEAYVDLRVTVGRRVSVFGRGRLRWNGDTGNDDLERVRELGAGLRIRI